MVIFVHFTQVYFIVANTESKTLKTFTGNLTAIFTPERLLWSMYLSSGSLPKLNWKLYSNFLANKFPAQESYNILDQKLTVSTHLNFTFCGEFPSCPATLILAPSCLLQEPLWIILDYGTGTFNQVKTSAPIGAWKRDFQDFQ